MIELLVSGVSLLLLDQWSKTMVQRHVADGCFTCGPFLRIRWIRHRNPIYRRNITRVLFVIVWLVACGCAVVLHYSDAQLQGRVALLGLGCALGGAAGNLLDILRRRYVVDFIDLRWWPVFNLADVAILGGLAIAFWPRA